MQVAFVTQGDPNRMSGGSIYHRRLADLAGEHGAAVRFVSVPERAFPLAVVDGPATLRAAEDGSDLVVVDSLASNTLGPWIALHASDVPIVGSIHQDLGGIDTGPARRIVQTWFDRLAFGRAQRLVVPSEHLAAQLIARGLPADAMRVVQPGRDVRRRRFPVPAGDLRRGRRAALLCVGNWLARKGIHQVLDAVAQLPPPLATLHLVGDESVDPAYRRHVLARLGRPDLAGRVVRHGIVDPEDMGDLYSAADVFVLASTSEPYGMVYGEAMTAGLPVVGWAAGNLPHLVEDGVQGRVVPTGDRDGLAAALIELSTDEAQRARLAAAARARADELPTWHDAAARFFAVCREVAGDRAAPSLEHAPSAT